MIVQIQDAYGRTLKQSVTTAAPSGDWQVGVRFLIADGTPGSIYVYSTSPANGALLADDRVRVRYGSSCTIRTEWPVYIVGETDTLFNIARRTGSTVTELVQANCLTNAGQIFTGQRLYVPNRPVVPQPPASAMPTLAIEAPAPAASVGINSRVLVTGTARDITPGNIYVRALDNQGTVLDEARGEVVSGPDLDGAWTWEVELSPHDPAFGTRGMLFAYALSGVDASIVTHAVQPVVFGRRAENEPFITISTPDPYVGLDLDAGITVTGTAAALFEGNVVVQALNPQGDVLGGAIAVAAGESPGMEADWAVELTLDEEYVGRGEIVAFSPSPVDDSREAMATVDVTFGNPADRASFLTIVYPLPNSELTSGTETVALTGYGGGIFADSVSLLVMDEDRSILFSLPVEIDPVTGFWSMIAGIDPEIDQDRDLDVQAVASSPVDGSIVASDRLHIRTRKDRDFVSGEILAREQIALPDDAVVTVRVTNASLTDASLDMVLLAQQFITDPGQLPIKFAVPYDSDRVEENAQYSVGVRIEDGAGKLLFISTTIVPVITDDSPTDDVRVEVEPVQNQ